MSNDLHSILARHNLRGINVANFSTANTQHRPSPQQHQPYQYPAPVPQQRVQYPWGGVGQSSIPQSSVRPSFAWPAPPQPQYTIDPRHYSYNIWGKAPVYSLTGEDEEEEVEAEEETVEEVIAADAAVEKEESIETEKPAEDAAPEAIVDTTTPSANEDASPRDPVEDAPAEPVAEEASLDVPATEQSSDPPQEEPSPAIPTAAEPSAENEPAAVPTETAPQEREPEVVPEPFASPLAEEEAHASEPAPPDIIDGVEPDHQDSGEVIEAADPSVEDSAGSEVPAPAESVESVEQDDDNPDTSSKPTQEEQVVASQPPGSEAEVLELDNINVPEVPSPPSDKHEPADSSGGDISQQDLPSHDITTVEQQPIAEHNASPPEEQSSGPAASAEEIVAIEAPTISDDIQDADANEIVQVIDVNNDGSTDDTAAIIVVDVDALDATKDINIPPPPPAPHVTIAEPLKPSKSSKKKPSSKSSKSRHVEQPKERPLEIIPLKEGKAKPVAKAKRKNKVKGKSAKGSEVESVDLIPPPPPPLMVVDVPPPAPSPPPSGHIIEVVGTEEMQVIESGEIDEGDDAVVIVMNPSSPNAEADAGDAVVVEQPQVDDVSDEKEESNHAANADTAPPPEAKDETPEVVQAAETAVVAVPDQHKESEPNPATADPSCRPDAGATGSVEVEQSLEDVAVEQKEDEAPAAISSPAEVDVIVPALDERDYAKEAEGLAEPEKEPLHTEEETASVEPENEPPSEDSVANDSPQDQQPEDSTPDDKGSEPEEATVLEAEKLDGTQLGTAGDTTDSALVAVSSPAEEDTTNLPPGPVAEPSPASEESKSSNESSDSVGEDENISNEAKSDETVDAAIQEPFIEPATIEDEAPGKVPISEASNPESADTSGTDPLSNADTEASTCSDSSATVDETPPNAPAEIVVEPAPTLMELVALILPSDPVPQAEDIAVTKEESKGEVVEGLASTTGTAIESEASNSAPEAIIGEDSDSKEESVAKPLDRENVVIAPSEVPNPSEEAIQDADSEPARENEGGESEAVEKTTGEVVDGSQEPEELNAPVELAKIVTDNQELDETNSEADHDPGMEAGDGDQNKAPVEPNNLKAADGILDSKVRDTQPVQTTETAEAEDGTPSDDADVEKTNAQDTVAGEEVATESPETTPTSDEQAHGPTEPNNDALVVEVPDAGEAAGDNTKDSSSLVDEGPVAVETTEAEEGGTNIPQAEDTGGPTTEEKAPSDIADDDVNEGIAAPVAEAESHETRSPEEDATEASESAEVLEGDSAVGENPEADEVISQPVIEDAEIQKPAAESPPTEPVAGEPTADCPEDIDIIGEEPADQAQQASETVVVEAADTGAYELSGEQGLANTSEAAAGESSGQSVEANAEQLPEQPAHTTEDATPSTTGVGSETEEQVCQESPLPVLAEEAQTVKSTEELEQATPEDLSKPAEITEATQPVDTAPTFEETPEPNEEPSPAQQPISTSEEQPVDQPQPEDAAQEPEERPEEAQPPRPESQQASAQEPVAEAEVLPEDSISQQTRCRTVSDSTSGRRSPLIEEAAPDEPAQAEDAAPLPPKHSPRVSFDDPPVSAKGKEPASPPKERRKSSKSSSSNRHSSSRHKVKDVSRQPSDQKSPPGPTSSRRRNSTTTTPQLGLFRRISTTNSRSTRAEAAEQAEIRRRAADLAAREQEVQRQLERARKRAALEEQERLLREKEEELARLRAVEKEKKRARREEQQRREQEALEQERLVRERAEEEARAKELERAERRKRRRESERPRHGDDHPRHRRHSSKRETEVRDVSPTAKPKARRQRTEEISSEHQRSRGEYDTREAPSSSRRPEERRHHRSSRRDPEKADKPKKSIWKSIFSKI